MVNMKCQIKCLFCLCLCLSIETALRVSCISFLAFIHECSLNAFYATCCMFVSSSCSLSPSLYHFLPHFSPLFFLLLLLPSFHPRLAGCYVGPVARGWSPGVDVVPGRPGCSVHRHETAILRTRRLHALRCRSAHTHTHTHTHNKSLSVHYYTRPGSKATHSLCA